MAVKWLIQDTDIVYDKIKSECDAIKKIGMTLQTFGVIKNTEDFPGLEDLSCEDDFIIRCGIKFMKSVENGSVNIDKGILQKLKKGIFHDSKLFDQFYYKDLNLPLLNGDAEFLNVKDNLFLSYSADKFIKPTKDEKAFSAGILRSQTPLKFYIENSSHIEGYEEETFLVAKCKPIYAEYRFICFKDTVLAGSYYIKNEKLFLSDVIPVSIMEIAKEYVNLYQPADIFSMDLCETPEGVKIIEYNCWNCSGLYGIDKEILFKMIKECLF